MWWCYNKFDTTKLLGVRYWCVKIPQCGYMEHRLKHITFYVQKHIAALEMYHNPGQVRDKPLGASTSVKLVYWGSNSVTHWWQIVHKDMMSPSNLSYSIDTVTFFNAKVISAATGLTKQSLFVCTSVCIHELSCQQYLSLAEKSRIPSMLWLQNTSLQIQCYSDTVHKNQSPPTCKSL